MRTSVRLPALICAGVLGVTTAGCGGSVSGQTTAAGGPVAVTASDTTCEVARTSLDAGTSVFAVTNSGRKVTEFYVYAPGDRVMGEVENIAPGLSRELHVELPAGSYETACKPGMIGKGIRAALTVSGSAAALTDDAALAVATDSYARYVKSQTAALETRTAEFVAAVKGGDVPRAKALYSVARTYWERIEPVAEIFGDLDPRIDGREEVTEEGMKFGGFHRIEKDLWAAKPDVSEALRPVLEERDPALVKAVDTEFTNVDATLARHRSGDGWKLHNALTKADLKGLSDAINALAEPISKVAAVVARK